MFNAFKLYPLILSILMFFNHEAEKGKKVTTQNASYLIGNLLSNHDELTERYTMP